MTTMKMYGEGLQRLEEVSQEIIQEMVGSFLSEGSMGKPVDPKFILTRATGKIITSLVCNCFFIFDLESASSVYDILVSTPGNSDTLVMTNNIQCHFSTIC